MESVETKTEAVGQPPDGGGNGPDPSGRKVGLILSGAGSRGAYEAGVLSVLLPLLKGDMQPRVVLGTSAGALNAALLAAFIDRGVKVAADELERAWRTLEFDKVIKTPRRGAITFVKWHLRRQSGRAVALLDTSPLGETLKTILPTEDYGRNVRNGHLDSLGIVASSCSTARAVVFLEGRPPPAAVPDGVRYVSTRLGIPHLMASAAFPLAFPPQWIATSGSVGDWYIDGGVHLNTPLKPAIDLGADLLLVVGGTPMCPDTQPSPDVPPNAIDSNGQILHALLMDRLESDLANLHTINRYAATGTSTAGAARVIRTCVVNPSDDRLSDVAKDLLPPGLANLLLSFGGYGMLGPVTRQSQQPGQFLSYLCFDKDFVDQAITQGKEDANRMIAASGTIPWDPPLSP